MSLWIHLLPLQFCENQHKNNNYLEDLCMLGFGKLMSTSFIHQHVLSSKTFFCVLGKWKIEKLENGKLLLLWLRVLTRVFYLIVFIKYY